MFFLGQIAVGPSGANSNQATGSSFGIPPGTKGLYLQANASGLLFELGFGTATGSTFATTVARGAQLDGPGMVNGPFRAVPIGPGVPTRTVVSIFNGQGATLTVNVYSAVMS